MDAVLKVCRNKWGDSDVELPVDAEGTFTLVRDAGADTAWIFRDGLLVAPASIEDADDIARDISALTGGPQLGDPNFFQWAEG